MTSELKPCPFCGGQAERIEVREDDGFENRGGVAIECRQCRASSHVEFGRVENLVSSWNTRATPSADTLAGLVRYTYDTLPASMCLNNVGIAIYSEAAAEIEKLKEQNDKFKWQVRDTCTRAEAAEAELARIKAQEPVAWANYNKSNIMVGLAEEKSEKWLNPVPLYASPVSDSMKADAARYQYLRSRDIDTVREGGIFAGVTPENYVINGIDLDNAIDALLKVEASND